MAGFLMTRVLEEITHCWRTQLECQIGNDAPWVTASVRTNLPPTGSLTQCSARRCLSNISPEILISKARRRVAVTWGSSRNIIHRDWAALSFLYFSAWTILVMISILKTKKEISSHEMTLNLKYFEVNECNSIQTV